MDRIAFVFPGQGSQYVGMGKALAEASPAAATVLAEADDALGKSISRLAFDGPAEQLDLTVNSQPALVAVSIAFLAALRERWAQAGIAAPEPAFAAGHSMGQYSAMVAAGVISLPAAVRLVRERGRHHRPGRWPYPGTAGPGRAARQCDRRQPQLPGSDRDLRRPHCRGSGRRGRQGPGRPTRDSPAGQRRGPFVADGRGRPGIPLLANSDARPITTADGARGELIEHLTRGVDWVAAVQRMTADGVTTFVEIGPGKVLTGLIKRIAPEATALSVDEAAASGGICVPFTDGSAVSH